MVKFEGSVNEWLEAITFTRKGYLKKPKTWRCYAYWWEDEGDDSKWFLNWSTYEGKDKFAESVFVTAQTAEDHIVYQMRDGREMYIDEE